MSSESDLFSDGDAHITYTVRVTAWIVIALSLFWLMLSLAGQQWVVGAVAAFVLVGTSLSLLVVLMGYNLLGRLLWYVIGVAAITAAVFLVHPAGNVEAMYAALLGGPFLTFSIKRERNYLIAAVLGVMMAWLCTRILGHDYFGPPLLDAEFARNHVSFFALSSTFVVVSFEMGVFTYLMYKSNERLRASREAADVANRAKSEFLAAMSHEIRTPMNGVVSMVEILENTELTPDQRRILQTVQESSASLLRIIEDILDMSKIEAGKLELLNEPTDLLHTVEAAVDTLRSYSDSYNVDLSLHFDMSLPRMVTCDAGRLRQVILNLLGNAIKFSRRPADEPRGHVHLSVTRDAEDRMRLVFRDDGIGISEEFQAQLFEPFRQSEDVTTRRYGGSGLGLAIVQQLVTKMNGTISVESVLGEGAEFTLDLPIVEPSQSIETPDFTDTAFVVFRAGERQRKVWKDYIGACGGVMIALDERDDLWDRARARSRDAVFVMDMYSDSQDDRDALIAAFRKDFPEARMIVLNRIRNVAGGTPVDGTAIVQAGPLLPSELWAGLRQLQRRGTADSEGKSLRPGAITAKPAGAVPRILVAEDNEINQVVIRRQIEQLGYLATIVGDGREAVKEWMNGDFDIVLTDCHMPEMDGFALTQHIRDMESARPGEHIPIVAITANALNGEAERCLSAGMDAYLSKPVKLAELKSTIDALARQNDAA
ncbi:ATP-binding protein [Lutimaribacter saemankumensis]|uniref:Sensory/regulatory protein RpfC n=1 Tax=Lutimaribacter saemankumensis TaxID=490829 RepID=A0A1G8PBU5_9RHOB|nr:ATP-binding protein [Lutimaribacter saemankumensis]SDI89993.1 Signal transduction histidine kinase [Lutimaribacter saemankumensis]